MYVVEAEGSFAACMEAMCVLYVMEVDAQGSLGNRNIFALARDKR